MLCYNSTTEMLNSMAPVTPRLTWTAANYNDIRKSTLITGTTTHLIVSVFTFHLHPLFLPLPM